MPLISGHPVALRYPRGAAYEGMQEFRAPIEYGKSEVLYEEEDIAVIFVGHMAELADGVRRGTQGYRVQLDTLSTRRFVKPLDTALLRRTGEGSQTVCDH